MPQEPESVCKGGGKSESQPDPEVDVVGSLVEKSTLAVSLSGMATLKMCPGCIRKPSSWRTFYTLHASAIGNGRLGFWLPHGWKCGMKTLNISIIHVNVELYVGAGLHYAVERLVFHSVVTVDNVVVDDGVLLLRHLFS